MGAVQASGGGSSKPKASPRSYNYVIKESGDVTYVKLNTMMMQVFGETGVSARIALGLDFETKSGDESKLVKALPRLQAKYTEFVTQRGGPAIKKGKLRLSFLRNNLQKITDRLIGEGVAEVLIREAIKL